MSNEPRDAEAATNALARLRRAQRRTSRLMSVGFAVVGAGLLGLGWTTSRIIHLLPDVRIGGVSGREYRTVEAERFVLRDPLGQVRGTWTESEGTVSFQLIDREGEVVRLFLGSSPRDGGLGMADENGATRIRLGYSEEGSEIGILDSSGVARAVIGLGRDDDGTVSSYVRLLDEEGDVSWSPNRDPGVSGR
jgi:hypothetical protein